MSDFSVINGGVTAPKGFKASGIYCGIKRKNKDMALLYSVKPAVAAGLFTQNKVKAAPVLVSMERIKSGRLQAVSVISGNANACTGEQGLKDAYKVTEVLGELLGIEPSLIAPTSTGVIGVYLPMETVLKGLPESVASLSEDGGSDAAAAIMTTDTIKKEVAVEFEVEGKAVRIGGMAKGSGMIHPNMATMLGFVTTDAAISHEMLKKALKDAADRSFNSITVDGDTSTNDMLIAMANGEAGNSEIKEESPSYSLFYAALEYVCKELAKAIVMDGEGASKFIEVEVKNGRSYEDCRTIAMAIAKSSLVKTAIFGEDANWGRILAAAGYSGGEFDPDKTDVYIGDVKTAENGMGLRFDEDAAKKVLSGREVKVTVDLKEGSSSAVVWTCDLTYDYVKINASYRS